MNYDSERGLASTIFRFGPGDEEKHIQQALSRREIEEKLETNNFEIEGVYRNLRFEEADEKTDKLIFIVRR